MCCLQATPLRREKENLCNIFIINRWVLRLSPFTCGARKQKTPAPRHNTPVWPIVVSDDWYSMDHGFYELNNMLGPLIILLCARRPQFWTIHLRCGEALSRAQTTCHCKINLPFILRENTGEAMGMERLLCYRGGIVSSQQKNVTRCWYKKFEGSQKTKLKPPFEKRASTQSFAIWEGLSLRVHRLHSLFCISKAKPITASWCIFPDARTDHTLVICSNAVPCASVY